MQKYRCWNTDAGTQKLKHSAETAETRCYNSPNTEAETQMKHSGWNTEAETQMLEHRSWNTEAVTAETQMLEHRS
jgi:hypothetical protein